MSDAGTGSGWAVHGGIEVDADDLYVMAAATRRAGAVAHRAAIRLSALELRWGPAVALLEPGLMPAPGVTLAMLLSLPFTLRGCARELHDRGLSVTQAARGYVAIENLATSLMDRLHATAAYELAFYGGADSPHAATVDPASLVEPLAAMAGALYVPRPVMVGSVAAQGSGVGPSDIAAVLGLLAGVIPGSPQPVAGSLPENRLDIAAVTGPGPDGGPRTTYVVALPGTSAWDLPLSPDPSPGVRNLEANLRLMSGQTTAEIVALPAALEAAGVPAGATVMFVGHSQGGMTAYAAAGNPTLRARYRITHVVTAGSPIGAMSAPEGVRVLSLENIHDLVPTLDGRPNADSVGRVTVRFDGGHAGADELARRGAAHHITEYTRAAQGLGDVRSGPLGEYLESARSDGFLVEPGTGTSSVTRVELKLLDP